MSVPSGPLSWTEGDATPPLFLSLVAYVFAVFLAAGAAFGRVTGSVRGGGDIVRMMTAAMADLAPYLLLVFVAAHFVVLLAWSNLGQIAALAMAGALLQASLPPAVLLGAVVLIAAALDFVVPSASAKWAVMAPVLVPPLLLAA
jgi:aminobenzoyl-glutamate transport protein